MTSTAGWKARPDRAEYDEMREQLTAAAWELVSAIGVKRLTLGRVAQQAGCSRSSIYRYFDSKEELLGSVLQDRLIVLAREMESVLGGEAGLDPQEQILRGFYLALTEVRSGPSLELIGTLVADEGQAMVDILLEYVPRIAPELMSVDPIFQQAREQGLVRDNVSDEEIMRWLVTVAISLLQQTSADTDPEAEMAYLRKMLLPSIFNPRQG